jgi:hypothetical protein
VVSRPDWVSLSVRFGQAAARAASPKRSLNGSIPISLPFIWAMASRPTILSCPGNCPAPPVGPMVTAMAAPQDS